MKLKFDAITWSYVCSSPVDSLGGGGSGGGRGQLSTPSKSTHDDVDDIISPSMKRLKTPSGGEREDNWSWEDNKWDHTGDEKLEGYMERILSVEIDGPDHLKGLEPLVTGGLTAKKMVDMGGRLPFVFFNMMMADKYGGIDKTSVDDWKSVMEATEGILDPKKAGGAYARIDIQTVRKHRAIMHKIIEEGEFPLLVRFAQNWLRAHPEGDEEYEDSTSTIIYIGQTAGVTQSCEKRWSKENNPGAQDGAALQWLWFNHDKLDDSSVDCMTELTFQFQIGHVIAGSSRDALMVEAFIGAMMQRSTLLCEGRQNFCLLSRDGSGLNQVIGGLAFGSFHDGTYITMNSIVLWFRKNLLIMKNEVLYVENGDKNPLLVPYPFLFTMAELYGDDLLVTVGKQSLQCVTVGDVHFQMVTNGGNKLWRLKKEAMKYLNKQMKDGVSLSDAVASLENSHLDLFGAYKRHIDYFTVNLDKAKQCTTRYESKAGDNLWIPCPQKGTSLYSFVIYTMDGMNTDDWRYQASLKEGISWSLVKESREATRRENAIKRIKPNNAVVDTERRVEEVNFEAFRAEFSDY